MKRAGVAAAAGFLMVALLGASALPQAAADHVDSSEIEEVLCRDCIPAITDPQFEDASWLQGSDRVVGIVVNGEARAYPTRILNWHEIADDVVGGVPVAVTYCPLCATGLAFDRRVAGQTLTFGVSGKLWRNNLVMYDHETGSLWTQFSWNAILGALHGTTLARIDAVLAPWLTWSSEHPDSKVLARVRNGDGSFARDYGYDPYYDYYYGNYTLYPVRDPDPARFNKLHPKALVLGIDISGIQVAFPYSVLREEGTVNFKHRESSVVVVFWQETARVYEARAGPFTDAEKFVVDGSGSRYDKLSGRSASGDGSLVPYPGTVAFWFVWYDYHRSTYIYREDSIPGSGPSWTGPLGGPAATPAAAGVVLTAAGGIVVMIALIAARVASWRGRRKRLREKSGTGRAGALGSSLRGGNDRAGLRREEEVADAERQRSDEGGGEARGQEQVVLGEQPGGGRTERNGRDGSGE